ncbi:MAG: hypothetical protein QOJ90_2790 [Actinomycetota bacterium]|nr:hypothetical protein [Actinomycetota bacterium]
MSEESAPLDKGESDSSVLHRISQLIEREHRLREDLQAGVDSGTREADRELLAQAEEALDQCWDLLRQRQARRTTGQNPDEASPRPVSQVENYLQ